MLSLVMLTADERLVAKQYHLEEYFKDNNNYVSFVVEIKEILEKRFGPMTKSDWAKNGFANLAQEILQWSDPLFDYVNNIHAKRHGGANIPTEKWKRVCHISSKIIVYRGWVLESKQ